MKNSDKTFAALYDLGAGLIRTAMAQDEDPATIMSNDPRDRAEAILEYCRPLLSPDDLNELAKLLNDLLVNAEEESAEEAIEDGLGSRIRRKNFAVNMRRAEDEFKKMCPDAVPLVGTLTPSPIEHPRHVTPSQYERGAREFKKMCPNAAPLL